jgi:hypothetical protein
VPDVMASHQAVSGAARRLDQECNRECFIRQRSG